MENDEDEDDDEEDDENEEEANEDNENEEEEDVDDDDDDEDLDHEEEEDMSERKRKVPKREKFDSGICTDMDNTQEGGGSSTDSYDDLRLSDDEGHTPREYQMEYFNMETVSKLPQDQRVEIEDVPVYSVIMRQKICSLPLPSSLKDYLNYYRPF